MNKSSMIKKTLIILLSFALVLSSIGIIDAPYAVYANDDPVIEYPDILDDVTSLQWTEESSATLCWDAVEGANYYAVSVKVYGLDETTYIGSSETGTTSTEIDIQQEIHSALMDLEHEVVKVKATVTSQFKQDDVINAQGNGVDTSFKQYSLTSNIQLPTPTNVQLSDDYVVEFSYDNSIIDDPQNIVNHVTIYVKFNGVSGARGLAFYPRQVEWDNGTARLNIEELISESYRYYTLSEDAEVACNVTLYGKDGYYNSTASTYSDYVTYSEINIQLPTPTNVQLSDDYVVEFSYDNSIIGAPQNIVNHVTIYVKFNGVSGARGLAFYPGQVEWDNGTARLNIEELISESYRYYSLTEDAEVACNVTLYGKDGYYNSTASTYSDYVIFHARENVESLTLSPSAPIICKGKSYFLGKTIEPVEAYYENIDWSSDNTSIVSVDQTGKITGVSAGTTYINAAIGDVTARVPVTVYEITSNIEDETSQEEVTDTAGEIIDDIANNEDPDLSNTDIDPDDVDEIKDEIADAIQHGDTFHTDITYIQQAFDSYKHNWGQIQKEARELNAEFEGAYTIEVEMYHKDSNNQAHHIGNITEFENEITFTIDITTGNSKRYVLVRVHKNANGEEEYEPIDYTVNNDGTISTKSNKFSDFILLSVDDGAGLDEKSETTVTIMPPTSCTYGDSIFLLDVSVANEGTDGEFTYSSSNTDVLNVSRNGSVAITGAGTATIMVGYDSDEYTGEGEVTITVDPKELTVTNVTVENKEYDGTVNATITNIAVNGLVGNDTFVLASGAKAEFVDKNVGTNKDVAVTGLASGDSNYTLSSSTFIVFGAAITAKPVKITGIKAKDKEYDGTKTATLDLSDMTLTGKIDEDDLAVTITGAFADANVGKNKTVSINFALTGDDKNNYSVDTANSTTSTTASITKASTEISFSTPATFTYGDSEYQINARLSNEEAGGVFTYTSSNENVIKFNENGAMSFVGAGTATITVAYESNGYEGEESVELTVNPRRLIVTEVAIESKDYDGTTAATIKEVKVNGLVGNDTLKLASGAKAEFADKNAGVDKNVSITGLASSDSNYVLASSTFGTKGSISTAVIDISGTVTAQDKYYDGNTDAQVDATGIAMSNIVSGDDISAECTGQFEDAFIGNDKYIIISISLTGADSDNYQLGVVVVTSAKASILDPNSRSGSGQGIATDTKEETSSNSGEGSGSGTATGGGAAGGSTGGTTSGSSTGGETGNNTSSYVPSQSQTDTSKDTAESERKTGTDTGNDDIKKNETESGQDVAETGADTTPEIKRTTTTTDDADGVVTTTTSTTYTDGSNVTEKVVEKPDGSSESTTTTTEADGTKIVEKVVEKADGSSKSTTTTTETDGTKTTETVEKKANGTEITTTTVKESDGSSSTEKVEKETNGTVTTTNTTKDADGASITEKVVEKPDGSITTTNTEKDADGNVLSTSKVVEKTKDDGTRTITATEKNADGSSSTSKTTINTDGSSKTNTTTQNADGSTTKEKITEKADGSLSRTATTTDEDGNVLSTEKEKVSVSKSGTVTSETTTDNADGSHKESTVKTKADGSATSTLTETDADGNITVTVGSTKKDGAEIAKKYIVEENGIVLADVEATTASASIPASVKVNGKSVPVTSVGEGAMKDNQTIKKVTLSDSITSIGEDAFSGAKNLKTIKLSANITEIAPGAFDGIKSNATFYISAATDEEFDALVALLKKSGVGSKVKFKRA